MRVTGAEQDEDPQAGIEVQGPLHELAPVHVGNPHIGHQEARLSGVLLEPPEPVPPASAAPGAVAQRPNHAADDRAGGQLVIDDQDQGTRGDSVGQGQPLARA